MQANDMKNLFAALQKKDAEDRDVQAAVEKLSASQRETLNGILASPEKLKEMLGSEQARELMKKLGKREA